MVRICPDCSLEMQKETMDGVQLDICPRCAGIWFGPEALRDLMTRDPMALTELEAKAIPHIEQKPGGPSIHCCPDCRAPLQEFYYLYDSPILLHSCPNDCGLWVEDGELDKMREWLDKSHKPETPDMKAQIALSEATMEQNSAIQRQHSLLRFFDLLGHNCQGWVGLVP